MNGRNYKISAEHLDIDFLSFCISFFPFLFSESKEHGRGQNVTGFEVGILLCCKSRQSLLGLSCVLDSMKEDFIIIQKSMDDVTRVTNSWKSLLRGSK